jgi:Protein of unknown function (DUF2795)
MVASATRRQLQQCLSEVDFPVNTADLLDVAGNAGDDKTLRALQAIPPETYTNVNQVLASVTIVDDRDIRDGDEAAARRTHANPGLA